jgi:hypothetical protein
MNALGRFRPSPKNSPSHGESTSQEKNLTFQGFMRDTFQERSDNKHGH